nr:MULTISPECIES: OprD family porin [unclassified Pseudomonas]
MGSVSVITSLGALMALPALASQQSDTKGFVEDSKLSVLNRNFYINRDMRNGGSFTAGSEPRGYGSEWGQGVIGRLTSGFTQGTIGFGVDALGLFAAKLDTGDGRSGLLALERDDERHAKDTQAFAGAALKMRLSNTELKYGDQMVNLPVFSTADTRLLPETAEGWLLTSQEIKDLSISAGHFTGLRARNDSSHDSVGLTSTDLAGLVYKFSKQAAGSFYYADTDNRFRKYYVNGNYVYPLNSSQSLSFDANYYNTKGDSSLATYDRLDNQAFSLSAGYSFGPHKITLSHQRIVGDGGYNYGIDGNTAIFLANSVQLSDFNQEDERSWQLKYDLNMVAFGYPGLNFMTRYLRGDGFTAAGTTDGKEWERDTEIKYVVQSGAAKDLSLRVRHAVRRTSDIANGDIDEIRIITEYPINIF